VMFSIECFFDVLYLKSNAYYFFMYDFSADRVPKKEGCLQCIFFVRFVYFLVDFN
jgi:hypothetical protein